MKNPLDSIERNETCPCGSGRKYKKCCQVAVEEQAAQWKNKWLFVNEKMAGYLGLIGGLSKGNGQPVKLEKLEEILEGLSTKIFDQEEKDIAEENIDILMGKLETLLVRNTPLHFLLFSQEQVDTYFDWFEEKAGIREGTRMEEADFDVLFEKKLGVWLDEVIGEERTVDMAERLVEAIRFKPWNEDDLAALLLALAFLLNLPPSMNPAWKTLFTVSSVIIEDNEGEEGEVN
ncbi:MAG: SEC-C domain-containing protein [Clostridia bacterium]|jgi:hypothetical protein|nr:SEC-C domain-containing protein [Clostridia bacterium]